MLAVFGCGYWQKFIIKKAHEMGLQVIGLDGAPLDLTWAGKDCDVFIEVDISNPFKCLMALEDHSVDGCITSMDTPQQAIGLINSVRGLNGIKVQQSVASTNKIVMKGILTEINADTAPFSESSIIKPSVNSGSRGVHYRAPNEEIVNGFFGEEFIEGVEHTVDGFVSHDILKIIGISDKYKPEDFVSTHICYQSGVLLTKVRRVIQKFIEATGLNNCPIHAEVIESDDGKIYVLEIASRMASGIGTHILPYLSGNDYLSDMIKLAIGEKLNNIYLFNSEKLASFYFFTPVGQITKIRKFPDWVIDGQIKHMVGQHVKLPKTDGDRTGHAIFFADNKSELLARRNAIEDIIEVR